MQIIVEDKQVTATNEQGHLGEMTFVRANDEFYIIDHTGVSDAARGLGVGKQLVAKFVDYAREQNMKVLPLCPFAKAEFAKNNAYSDVLFQR